jgi:hypothetical protein
MVMGWVRGSHVARPPLTGRTGPRACPGTPWRTTHQCNDQVLIYGAEADRVLVQPFALPRLMLLHEHAAQLPQPLGRVL